MDVDALLAAFRRLQTNESRGRGLAALVRELTPYEWRDLHKLTAARSFQFDIIGKLPVEIVAQIFTHLEPTAPYLLQRVSPQWHHVLRSTDILASSLYTWSGLVTDLQVATLTQCEHNAKRIQEFRQGEPNRLFSIHHHEPHGRVMLVEDTLIWSCIVLPDSKARMVYVLNIKSWNLRKLQGDARETVYRLFASDQLVGFASSSNVCYVWTLDGYEKRKFRVPSSALFQSVTCRDSTVACAGCLNDHALVYIWNYETQRGVSFKVAFDTALFGYPVPGCDHQHGLALLLQSKDEHIIVFADERCSNHVHHDIETITEQQATVQATSITLRFSRYTYAGQCISTSKATFKDRSTDWSYVLSNPFTPVNRRGLFRISLTAVCLQFDEQQLKFTAVRPAIAGDEISTAPSLFWWNDTFFQGRDAEWTDDYATWSESGIPGTWPVLVHVGTSDRATCNRLPRQCREIEDPNTAHGYRDRDGQDIILLNDKYIIRTFHKYFEVSCFGDTSERSFTDESFFGVGSSREFQAAEHKSCRDYTISTSVLDHSHHCSNPA